MTIGYDKGTLCFTLSDKEMLTWLVFLHWSTHRSCFNLMSSLQLEQSHMSYNATTLHSGSGWNAQVITSSKITKNMHPLWCWCLHGLPPTVKPYSDTIRTKKWIWTNDGEKKLEKMVETLKKRWKMKDDESMPCTFSSNLSELLAPCARVQWPDNNVITNKVQKAQRRMHFRRQKVRWIPSSYIATFFLLAAFLAVKSSS